MNYFPQPLPSKQVSLKSYLSSKKSYLSWTTGQDVLRALKSLKTNSKGEDEQLDEGKKLDTIIFIVTLSYLVLRCTPQ